MGEVKWQPILRGRAIKLGDHIDTDLIYPGKYVPLVDPSQWPQHALEGIDPQFPQRLATGDIIVAGSNFGCGSSRSQAVSCLKLAGISAIVAVSFARIYYRNCINQGLPAIESERAPANIEDGTMVTLHLEEGWIECEGARFSFAPLPDFLLAIIKAGGLVPYTRARLHTQSSEQR